MKTIFSILTSLLFCVMLCAQNNPVITVEEHIAQPISDKPKCIVPDDALVIQLIDIKIIDSSLILSDAEKTAFEQNAKMNYETQNTENQITIEIFDFLSCT